MRQHPVADSRPLPCPLLQRPTEVHAAHDAGKRSLSREGIEVGGLPVGNELIYATITGDLMTVPYRTGAGTFRRASTGRAPEPTMSLRR